MTERYISGEEYRAMHPHAPKQQPIFIRLQVAVVLALVALVGGFVGGMQLQKHNDASKLGTQTFSANTDPSVGFGAKGGPTTFRQGTGGGQGPVVMSSGQAPIMGTVVSINSSSVTIKPSNGTDNQTYGITGATNILDGSGDQPAPISYDKIKAGDTVGVSPTSSSSNQAMAIVLNPRFMTTSTNN